MEDREAFLEERRTLGDNVRRERKRLDLSQEALGLRCKRSTSEISRLERAKRDTRFTTLMCVARALEIPPTDLLDGIP